MASSERRLPVWGGAIAWLALVTVAQAALNWHLLTRSYFFVDDFVVLHDGLVSKLTLHYLASEPIAHFSPGHRLVTWLLAHHAHFDYRVAAGFLLAAHSAGVVLVQRILRISAGDAWWTFVLAFAYGVSIILTPSLQWTSAGLLTIPAAAFALAAIHAHLRWRVSGEVRWLAWSAVAVAGGLFFYEKAALIPVYLVAMRVLVFEPRQRVGVALRSVASEWRAWAAYAVPIGLYIPAYLSRTYLAPWHGAPINDVMTYLRVAWLDSFVPALLGVRVTITSGDALHTWAVGACQVGMLALIAASVARRNGAWRVWLLFALVFVVNALIVLPRLDPYGPYIVAYTYRYMTEPAFLFVLCAVWAFSPPRTRPVPIGERPARAPLRRRTAAIAVAALVVGAYTLLSLRGGAAIIRDSPAAASRVWVSRVRADVAASRRAGIDPVLLEGPVQGAFAPVSFDRVSNGGNDNRLSAVVTDFIGGLRFDMLSPHTFTVSADGHLRPVAFQAAAGGPVASAAMRRMLRARGDTSGTWAASGCLTSGAVGASLELVPQPALRGQRWYLLSRYRSDPGVPLLLSVDRGVGYPPSWDRGMPVDLDGHPVLTELGALPTGVPTLARLRIDLPAGHHRLCIYSLLVGYYRPA